MSPESCGSSISPNEISAFSNTNSAKEDGPPFAVHGDEAGRFAINFACLILLLLLI